MFPKTLLVAGSSALLGMLSNLLCLVANHGKMPVFVGFDAPMDWLHCVATPTSRLLYIADRFYFHNLLIYSVGDLLIAGGVFLALSALAIRWAYCAFNVDCKQVPWYDA